jgi:molybdopterin-guanine dinucleotide biosynthesis protein A
MGMDKATLLYRGEPLWSRQLKVFRELKPETIWASARSVPAWAREVDEVILDEPPSRGPLSGIAAALFRVKTSHLLVLGIDLPNMTAEHLRQLVSTIQPGRGVIPVKECRFESVCAIYAREAVVAAQECLAGENLSLQYFANELVRQKLVASREIKRTEERLYLNLNTPADLQANLAGTYCVVPYNE